MNKLSKILLAALAAGTVQTACAFNYHDGDLLLVFRGGTGANDVEFNLGSVTNYLGKAAGTQIIVNYNTTVLSNNFNNQLDGVQFALFAATSVSDPTPRLWATDINLSTAAKKMAISPWLNLRGQMSQVGIAATQNSLTNSTANYVTASGSLDAYDFIAANGNPAVNNVSTWNGVLLFPTEGTIPAQVAFYQIEPSNTTPKPTASLVGSFALDDTGKLTFTSGMVIAASTIQGITRSGNTVTVNFSTCFGAIHRLCYRTNLTTGSWTTLSPSATGDGTTKSLSDTITDPIRFYKVVTSNN